MHTIETATAHLCDVLSAEDFAHEIAPSLSCEEVDAIALFLSHSGKQDAADAWIHAHAYQDDESDSHHNGEDDVMHVIYDLTNHAVVQADADEAVIAAAKRDARYASADYLATEL